MYWSVKNEFGAEQGIKLKNVYDEYRANECRKKGPETCFWAMVAQSYTKSE